MVPAQRPREPKFTVIDEKGEQHETPKCSSTHARDWWIIRAERTMNATAIAIRVAMAPG